MRNTHTKNTHTPENMIQKRSCEVSREKTLMGGKNWATVTEVSLVTVKIHVPLL